MPISFSDKKRAASDVVNFDYVITKGFVVPRDGYKALYNKTILPIGISHGFFAQRSSAFGKLTI